jgi:hypothetical protein
MSVRLGVVGDVKDEWGFGMLRIGRAVWAS